ncbi:unnamed protein product, partial [Musa textilis]
NCLSISAALTVLIKKIFDLHHRIPRRYIQSCISTSNLIKRIELKH